jgi:hypothetical protein
MVHCVANPPISSGLIDFVLIFIVTRLCFDQCLFFITTPMRDSAAVVAVSETCRHRRVLICYSRPAAD